MVKSLNSDVAVQVVFKNKTSMNIDIFWVDFEGNNFNYQKDLCPDGEYSTKTYETHPWIAKSSEKGTDLHVNGELVYMPQHDEGKEVQEIIITEHDKSCSKDSSSSSSSSSSSESEDEDGSKKKHKKKDKKQDKSLEAVLPDVVSGDVKED